MTVSRQPGRNYRESAAKEISMTHTDDLGPSPAQLGDTMILTPGEWIPLDDHGAEIYLYGTVPADIAFQVAPTAPAVTFRDSGGMTAVHVGAQRVAQLPSDDERAINAVVDVLEALGIRAERVTN